MNPPTQPAIPIACRRATPPETELPVASQQPARATTLLPLEAETRFCWSTALVANQGACANARLRIRPSLTMAHWRGDVDVAARVVGYLVDNAVRHGKPLGDGCVRLRLGVIAETDELLIEADDGLPGFPGFSDIANQFTEPEATPAGLWWITHYGGRLPWDVLRSADDVVVGKTVQAILPATGEVPA